MASIQPICLSCCHNNITYEFKSKNENNLSLKIFREDLSLDRKIKFTATRLSEINFNRDMLEVSNLSRLLEMLHICSSEKHTETPPPIFLQVERKEGGGRLESLASIPIMIQDYQESNAPKLPSMDEVIQKMRARDEQFLRDLCDVLTLTLETNTLKRIQIEKVMKSIAYCCENLSWNNESKSIVRNKFGKINYGKGGLANNECLDWDIYSRISYIFREDFLKEQLIDIIVADEKEFINELTTLHNSLSEIIHRESHNSVKTKIVKPALLESLLSFYSDYICLRVIYQLTSLEIYNSLQEDLTNKESEIKARYTIARIITRLGEASKHLSPTLKSLNLEIPLFEIGKIRDKLGHKLTLIKYSNSQFNELLKKFTSATEGVVTLVGPIKIVLDQFESIIEANCAAKERKKKIASFSTTQSSKNNKKIEIIKQKIDNHRRRVNVTNQPEVKSPTQVTHPVIKSDKIARMRNIIAELEAKSEGLTKDEVNKLITTRKSLETLEAKTKTTVIEKNDKSIDVEAALRRDVSDLYKRSVGSVCYELLDFVKRKSRLKGKPSQESSPAKSLKRLQYLIEELKFLAQLTENEKKDASNGYATEYCLSIIGQYLRDLKLFIDSSKLFPQLLKESKDATIFLRNKKIMHAVLEDSSTDAEVKRGIHQHTLTMTPDLEAIHLITGSDVDAKEVAFLQRGMESSYRDEFHDDLITATYEIGLAYLRLAQYAEAKRLFEAALKYCSPGYIAKEIFRLKLDNIVIVEEVHPTTQRARFTINNALALCYFYLGEHSESFEIYSKLIREYPKLEETTFCDNSWLVNYFGVSCVLHGSLRTRQFFLEMCQNACWQSIVTEPKTFAAISVNLADSFNGEKNFSQAFDCLDSVKLEGVTDVNLKLHFLRSLSFALGGRLNKKTTKYTYDDVLSADKSIEYMDQHKTLFENSEPNLKKQLSDRLLEARDRMEKLEEGLASSAAVVYSNYAMESVTSFDEKLRLLTKALLLQEKHRLSTDVTHLNIGLMYFDQAERATDIVRQEMCCKQSLDHFSKVNADEKRMCEAYTYMGYIYELQQKYAEAWSVIETLVKNTTDGSFKRFFLWMRTNHFDDKWVRDFKDMVTNCKLKLGLPFSSEPDVPVRELLPPRSSSPQQVQPKASVKPTYCGFKKGFLG